MTLQIKIIEAVGEKSESIPIVLLHGWASDSSSWQNILLDLRVHRDVWLVDLPGFGEAEGSEDCSLEMWLADMAKVFPERAIIMGWSLGGMLATRFAIEHPGRVEGLVSFASNLSFVAREGWPDAMAQETEQQFYQGFVENSDRTLKRFLQLMASGEAESRLVANQLKIMLDSVKAKLSDGYQAHWQQALRLLASIDNRDGFSHLALRGLHIFADGDALVPVSASKAVKSLNPAQDVEVIENAGHAAHITQIAKVMPLVRDYLDSLSAPQ